MKKLNVFTHTSSFRVIVELVWNVFSCSFLVQVQYDMKISRPVQCVFQIKHRCVILRGHLLNSTNKITISISPSIKRSANMIWKTQSTISEEMHNYKKCSLDHGKWGRAGHWEIFFRMHWTCNKRNISITVHTVSLVVWPSWTASFTTIHYSLWHTFSPRSYQSPEICCSKRVECLIGHTAGLCLNDFEWQACIVLETFIVVF